MMRSYQKLPHGHSSLGLLKSSSDTHSRETLFTTRSSTLNTQQPRSATTLCCWYVLFVETVRDEINWLWDKNSQNCKNSFFLGSFLTTRSRKYHDFKDSLSEIPFFVTRHTNKIAWSANWLVGLEPNSYHNKVLYTWSKKGLWQSLTSRTRDINKDKWQKWRKMVARHTPKSKSHMLTPKNSSLPSRLTAVSRVMIGVIFFVCSTSWISLCSLAAIIVETAGGTLLKKTESKTQKRVLKFGQETPSLKGVAGNSNLVLMIMLCLMWGVAGNSDGTTPKAPRLTVPQGPRETGTKDWKWTTITCKSQIMGTLRKSSRIFIESWIERVMKCLTWRPTYWSGDYLCRQQVKQTIHDQNLIACQNTNFEGIMTLFDISLRLMAEISFKFFEFIYFDVWLLSVDENDPVPWDPAIRWAKAKVHVYSDSVLCMGRISRPSEANVKWKEQIQFFQQSNEYAECSWIGETIKLECNIFLRIHTDWDSLTNPGRSERSTNKSRTV